MTSDQGRAQRYSVLPRRAGVGPLVAVLLAFTAAAETPAPVRLPSHETVFLGADDALEFTLLLPKPPPDALPLRPDVACWLLKDSDAAPPAAAPGLGVPLVWPSPRPGEWLVHVRGLRAPQAHDGKWDLLVRWTLHAEGAPATPGGEARLPGCLAFRAESADVVLLTDGSLSMGLSDPKRLRVDAARQFVAEARRAASVGRIAIVQFDNKVRTILGLTPVAQNFERALEQLDDRGQTDIDGGIRHALNVLGLGATDQAERRENVAGASIVLLTDGKQEPGEYRNAHELARKAGVAVHTLALGRDADRTLLRRIAEETGGTFADAAKDRDLALAYAAIASRIARARTIRAVALPAAGGDADVPVDGSCRSLAVSIACAQPGTLSVRGPDGAAWTSPTQQLPAWFAELPAAGAWHAAWKPAAAEPATALASARTALYPLFFRSDPQPAAGVELDTDEPALAVSLCEGVARFQNATVEATLRATGIPPMTVRLLDDGNNADGGANDGLYAAYLPPFAQATGAYPENLSGVVTLVVTGTREGQPLHREIEAPFVFRRHDGAALIAAGAGGLGAAFCGGTAAGEVRLRVRGVGGPLTVRALPPTQPDLRDISPCVTCAGAPPTLAARERRTLRFTVAAPELLEPGRYGGLLEFHLAGTAPARVPFWLDVRRPTLQTPPVIDLGEMAAGDHAPVQLQLTTDGGVLTVNAIELLSEPAAAAVFPPPLAGGGRGRADGLGTALPPFVPNTLFLTELPPAAVTCTPAPVDVACGFDLATDAAAGFVERWLVFRGFGRRELARVPVRIRVTPQHLAVDASLAFGPVETGDTVARPVRWRWASPAGLAPPANASVRVLFAPGPFAPHVELSTPEVRDGCAQALFTLTLPADAPPGEASGWLLIEAGPVLTLQRWSVFVVQPHLAVTPPALDFGQLLPGQGRARKVTFQAHAARPVAVSAATDLLAKPRMPGVTLPADALHLTRESLELAPGRPDELALELNVPDSAQDGLYRATLNVSSRLGTIAVPVKLTVVNDVTTAPFHVAPSIMLLRFKSLTHVPADRLRITSHRDEDIALTLEVKPFRHGPRGAEDHDSGALAALLLPSGSAGVHKVTLTLPPRATIELAVQARADAHAGEISCIHVSGDGEEHIVEVRIERPAVAQTPIVSERPSLLSWLLLLFLLLLMLAAVAAHFAFKRPWVRYVTYSLLFHVGLFPWTLPADKLMDALPTSMQITILQSQETLSTGLSEQQARRLEALKSATDAPPNTPATAEAPAARPPDADLPAPAATKADAPAATALDAARPPAERTELAAAPQPQRAAAAPAADAPLKPEALTPEPVAATQPQETARVQPRSVTPTVELDDAPLPAVPAPHTTERVAETALPAAQEAPETARVAMPAAPARPVREQPVAEDAPLAVAAPAAAPKSAAALATAERDAPAVALAPSAGAHAATVAEIGAVTDVTSRSAAPARGEELTASAGAGQETAAHVTQPDATTRPAGPGGGDAPDKALDAGPGAPARIAETGHAPLGQGGAESAQPRGGSVLGSPLPSRDGPGGGLAAGDRGAAAPTPGGTELGAFAGLQRDAAPIAGGAGTSTNAGARTASNIGGDAPLPAGSLGGAPVAVTPTQGGGTGNTAPSTARGGTALGTGVVASGAGTELALATGRDGGVGPGQASPLPRAGVGAERGVASAGTGTTPRRSPGTSALAGDQPLAAGSSPAVVGTRPTAGGVEQAPVRGGTALGSGVPGAGTAIALTGALTPGAGQGPYAAANLPRAQVGTGNAPRSGTSTATRRADGGVGTAGDGPLAAGAAPAVTAARGPGTAPGAGLADKGRAVAVPGTGLPGRLNPASVSTGLGQGYRPPPSEQKAAQPLNPAPSSTLLEAQRGQAVAAAPQSYVMPAQRLFNSAATGASLRLDLGLARHSGDWNSSPTALQYLRTAFLERAALPELEVNVATLNLSDLKAMLKCRVILITSNKPIAFTAAELATMREYIRLGGTLWVNDSSASDDETCDQSLRPALPQLVPGGELRTLPLEHPFFAVCYDLRKGFKEFRVPPGDKYRCDYLEAVFVPDAAGAVDEKSSRAGVIYTRNDYADGLVIDPRMNAGMKSLTDLTNAEMLESSLRFGMNLLAYSMGADAARLPPPPESAAEYEKMYRYKGPPLPVLDDYTVTLDQWQKPVWVAEQEWCNPTELRFLDDDALKSKAVALDFKGGQKFKAAATRFGQVDLSNSNALVFDLHSSVGRGCNVALLLVSKDGPSYESRPVFVRPGWNRNLRFPLDKGDMKSSASKEPWKEYDTPFEPRNAIERITILIYNLTDSGSVKIGPLRLQGQ